MSLTATKINSLLNEFESTPKEIYFPTYLELCRYPYRRFEEICSRLLAFFLNPKSEHGLRDLFLKSFLQVLEPDNQLPYRFGEIKITEEENAEGKRIDLIIRSQDFIIGIENKISADLYNPLKIYKEKLKQYTDKNYGVVLSLKKIANPKALNLLNENDFKNITYGQYFSEIKKNIGSYLSGANSYYLTVATDFIKTIENMDKQFDTELDALFFAKENEIKELLNSFNNFEQKIINTQAVQIGQLKESLKKITNDEAWWIYDKWDLGYTFLDGEKRIGIESFYKTANKNPLGEFIVQVNAWNEQDWFHFKPKLEDAFPVQEAYREDGRFFMTVDTLQLPEHKKIEEKLNEVYSKLRQILIK